MHTPMGGLTKTPTSVCTGGSRAGEQQLPKAGGTAYTYLQVLPPAPPMPLQSTRPPPPGETLSPRCAGSSVQAAGLCLPRLDPAAARARRLRIDSSQALTRRQSPVTQLSAWLTVNSKWAAVTPVMINHLPGSQGNGYFQRNSYFQLPPWSCRCTHTPGQDAQPSSNEGVRQELPISKPRVL